MRRSKITFAVLSIVRAAVPEMSAGSVAVARFSHRVLDHTFTGPVRTTEILGAAQVWGGWGRHGSTGDQHRHH